MGQRFSRRPVGVIVVGLDNSGKTTAVDWLAKSSVVCAANDIGHKANVIVPTVGYNARRFTLGLTAVTVLDMSGQGRYRNLWTYHLLQCDGIVFVVDGADAARLPVAFGELQRLLGDPALTLRRPCLPLLVLANKSDQATPPAELFRRLVNSLCVRCCANHRPCHVVFSCALNGAGLRRGFDWLLCQIAKGPDPMKDTRPTWYF